MIVTQILKYTLAIFKYILATTLLRRVVKFSKLSASLTKVSAA